MTQKIGDVASYFYSGQLDHLLRQAIRIFSGFYYKTSGSEENPMGELIPVPCKHGDISRIVAQLMRNNSENTARTVPLFAVWIKDVQLDASRRRGVNLESISQVTERSIDTVTGRYAGTPGASYTVSRLMPVPVIVKLQLDLVTSNTNQLWQILEQLILLFNPICDVQLNENPLDWSALTTMELEDINYNSKSIPVGVDDSYNQSTWTFSIPFHINPPAKVKQLVNIKTIITDTWDDGYFSEIITSVADHKISISGNTAILLGKFGNLTDENGNIYQWSSVIKAAQANNKPTMLRLRPGGNIAFTTSDIYANVSIDPNIANVLNLSFIESTLPKPNISSVISIIDPRATFPGNGISSPAMGDRYLILKNIVGTTVAWGSFNASANSIIEWNGSTWVIAFDPEIEGVGSIVQNLANSKLYVLIADNSWISCIEGEYQAGYWMLGSYPESTF